MSKTTLFFLFFLLVNVLTKSLNAEEVTKMIITDQSLPIELQIVIGQIQLSSSDPSHKDKIVQYLHVIDQAFSLMEEEDILFFSKSQVYKQILTNPPSGYQSNLSNDLAIIEDFDNYLTDSPNDGNLKRWLKSALRRDIERLRRSHLFQSTIRHKQQGSALSVEQNRFYQKIEIILPWLRFFYFNIEDQITQELDLLSKTFLKNLSLNLYQFLLFGGPDHFTPEVEKEDYQLFKIVKKEKETEQKEHDRILQIVERIIQDAEELPQPVNDWMPKESDNEGGQIMSPSPNYQPPTRLPKPVEDWFEDL